MPLKEIQEAVREGAISLHLFLFIKVSGSSPCVTRDCAFGPSCHPTASPTSALTQLENCSGTFKSLRKLRRVGRTAGRQAAGKGAG